MGSATLKDIKMLLTNNVYYQIVGLKSAILLLENTYKYTEGNLGTHLHSNTEAVGLVKMVNESVT